MKSTIKYITAFLAFSVIVLSSCSKWTDPEEVKLLQPGLDHQNPELYAKYMEALRQYRKSDHKKVYAFLDNKDKAPMAMGYRIVAMPDSVDVIGLMYPDNLVQRELEEMTKVRERGTKVIYTVSFTELEEAFKNRPQPEVPAATEGNEQPTVDPFVEFAPTFMREKINICQKYNYDGISISYLGKDTLHMTATQKAQYILYQDAFLNPIKEWKKANPSKMLVLEGRAQHIGDKSFLSQFDNFIIPSMYFVSTYAMDREIELTVSNADVPTDRFIVALQTCSLDEADNKTGYFGSKRAITETAYWMSVPVGGKYTKSGMAIYNIQNDYFNQHKVFKYTREAISVMN